jgi:hypothetical protein
MSAAEIRRCLAQSRKQDVIRVGLQRKLILP